MALHDQSNADIDRLKQILGEDLDFTPASESFSDAVPSSLETDAKAPALSDLQRQRLGTAEISNMASDFHVQSNEDLMRRFTTTQEPDQSREPEPASRNRVYFRKPGQDIDKAEVFAPKPVVVSGTTGTITERG